MESLTELVEEWRERCKREQGRFLDHPPDSAERDGYVAGLNEAAEELAALLDRRCERGG